MEPFLASPEKKAVLQIFPWQRFTSPGLVQVHLASGEEACSMLLRRLPMAESLPLKYILVLLTRDRASCSLMYWSVRRPWFDSASDAACSWDACIYAVASVLNVRDGCGEEEF